MPTTPNRAVLCVAAGDPPQLSVVTLPDGDDTPAPAQPGKARALVAVSCSVFDVGDRLVLQGRALPHREELAPLTIWKALQPHPRSMQEA